MAPPRTPPAARYPPGSLVEVLIDNDWSPGQVLSFRRAADGAPWYFVHAPRWGRRPSRPESRARGAHEVRGSALRPRTTFLPGDVVSARDESARTVEGTLVRRYVAGWLLRTPSGPCMVAPATVRPSVGGWGPETRTQDTSPAAEQAPPEPLPLPTRKGTRGPIPKGYAVTTASVRLWANDLERLKKLAARRGEGRSELLRRAVQVGLDVLEESARRSGLP